MPLYDAHREFVLSEKVLHTNETPVRMLHPGTGKHGPGLEVPGRLLGRVGGWAGMLTCDDDGGYDIVFKREGCTEASCLAHARRKFDELARVNASAVAVQPSSALRGCTRSRVR